MSRPPRADAGGRAYLDLQNPARRDGRPTQELLVLYAPERFLARLAASRHAGGFVLKGGMLLAAFDARRATVDADLLATGFANDEDADDPTGGVDLVLRPGQRVLVRLGDVLMPFTNAAGVQVPDFTSPRPTLHVDADVLAGYPVVAGTRVPFDLVAGLVAGGVPIKRIGDYYPASPQKPPRRPPSTPPTWTRSRTGRPRETAHR